MNIRTFRNLNPAFQYNPSRIFKLIAAIAIACNACGSSQDSSVRPSNPASYALTVSGPNVLPIRMGGDTICGKYGYPNEPCVSVTVCVPGTNNCQTIDDVLLDTGSTGLRVFSSVLTLPLPAVKDGSQNPMAECATFGTGSTWGTVVTADVVLASEVGVQTSIQLIDAAYATPPSACTGSDLTPTTAGYNGILGVGLAQYDCGLFCEYYSNNQTYYSCNRTTCTTARMQVTDQLQNPVGLLPNDNNGVVVQMPLIPTEGAASVTGSLILGIGTQSNNEPSGVTAYAANSRGNFTTKFNNQTYSTSFIDSGSNGIFFPGPANLPLCDTSSSAPGFFCPTSTAAFSAVTISAAGSPEIQINFQIANGDDLIKSGNTAYINLGGSISGFFDWGLPFFFGRKVYIGIDETTSELGTGPYWAF